MQFHVHVTCNDTVCCTWVDQDNHQLGFIGESARCDGQPFLVLTNTFVDFLAMNRDVPGSIDPESYLATVYAEDGNGNVIANRD